MIPGLEKAEFVRFGVMHRNTFLESPKLLLPTLQFMKRENLFAAGQITGTEGYAAAAAGAGHRARRGHAVEGAEALEVRPPSAARGGVGGAGGGGGTTPAQAPAGQAASHLL